MNEIKDNGFVQERKEVTILSGESLSDAVDLKGYQLVGVLMPSSWTTADITYLASDTLDGTYFPVYIDGIEATDSVDASRYIAISSNAIGLASIRFLKLRSGNEATPVTQGADRALTLCVKR